MLKYSYKKINTETKDIYLYKISESLSWLNLWMFMLTVMTYVSMIKK